MARLFARMATGLLGLSTRLLTRCQSVVAVAGPMAGLLTRMRTTFELLATNQSAGDV
jgi:hypothetical protein